MFLYLTCFSARYSLMFLMFKLFYLWPMGGPEVMSLVDIISGMRVQSRLTWYNPYLDQKSGISPRKPGSF